MRVTEIPLLSIMFASQLMASHPADTNADATIDAQELLAYTAISTDANLLQQVENIWKHGGAYSEDTSLGVSVFIPATGGATFTPIEDYAVDPITSQRITLPAAAEDLVAHFYLTENSSVYYPASLSEIGGESVISFPPHPKLALEGGTVYAELTQGYGTASEVVYSVGFVSIGALPVGKPGSFNELLGAMDDVIDHLETLREIDYSDYFVGGPNYGGPFLDDREEVEVALVRLLKDPNMQGGLQPVLALIAGDDAYSQAFRASLDSLQDYSAVTAVAELLPTQFTPPPSPAPGALSRSVPAKSSGRVFAYKPAISDAAGLNHYMREQYVAEQMLQDPIFSPAAGNANAVVGLAGPAGGVASAVYGTASSLLQLVYERNANTYPKTANLIANFSKTSFNRDDCGIIGTWTANATATSNGWNASAAVIDLTLNFAGSLDTAADSIKVGAGLGQEAGAAVSGPLIDVVDAGLSKVRDDSLKDLGKKSGLVEIPADTWEVEGMSTPYVEMTQTASILNIVDDNYFPEAIGSTTAFISARAFGDAAFPPGSLEASAPETIELVEAQLVLEGEPPNTYEPGRTYTITARAENLSNQTPTISWTADGGDLGTPTSLGDGRSQVDWTAPDPASTEPITITADLDEVLCYPTDFVPLSTSVVTSGGRYRIQASPQKDCYEPNELISLTFVDLDDASNQPATDFSLTGPGQISKTGPNTANLTYDGAGSVGVIASLEDDAGKFDFADFIYGCADLTLAVNENPEEVDILTATVDDVTINMIGVASSDGGVLSINFSAQTHYDLFQLPEYQEALAQWQVNQSGPPPEQPVLGQVGVTQSGAVFTDPQFKIQITMPYTSDDCGMPVVPSIITTCYYEADPEETIVITDGIAGDYTVDALLAASSTTVDVPGLAEPISYSINLVPTN